MLSQKSGAKSATSWKTIGLMSSALLGIGALFARSNAWATAHTANEIVAEAESTRADFAAMTADTGKAWAMGEDGDNDDNDDTDYDGNDGSFGTYGTYDGNHGDDDDDDDNDIERMAKDNVVRSADAMTTLRYLADNNLAMGFSAVVCAQESLRGVLASDDWDDVAFLAGYILGARPAGDATLQFAKGLYVAMAGSATAKYDHDFEAKLAAGASATSEEVSAARKRAVYSRRYLGLSWLAALPAFAENSEITGEVRTRFDAVCGLDASRCDFVIDALLAEHAYMTSLRTVLAIPATAKSAETVSTRDDNALRLFADFRLAKSAGLVPIMLDFVYTDEFTSLSVDDLELASQLAGYVAAADDASSTERRLVYELMYEAADIAKATTSANFRAGSKFTKDEAMAVAAKLRGSGGNLLQKVAAAQVGVGGDGDATAFEAFRFVPVCEAILGADSLVSCEKAVLLYVAETKVRQAYMELFVTRD